MGKVGTCLVTLAGLLLAAGAQTFTGKEPPRRPRGRAAPPAGGGGGGGGEGGSGAVSDGVGVWVGFGVFLFFFFFFLPGGADASGEGKKKKKAVSGGGRRRDGVGFAPLFPGGEGTGERLAGLGQPQGRAGGAGGTRARSGRLLLRRRR